MKAAIWSEKNCQLIVGMWWLKKYLPMWKEENQQSLVHPKNFEEGLVSEDKLLNNVWKLQSWSEKYRQ